MSSKIFCLIISQKNSIVNNIFFSLFKQRDKQMSIENPQNEHKNNVNVIPFTMQNCFSNFVGVIDSGVGGLTVLRQLQRDFPLCSFVYLADSANCPYGVKSPQEIQHRVETLIKFLQYNGAQAVVVACNTASVFADRMRAKFNLPIFDVIAPTCKQVASVTRTKKVALLATNATVRSQAYQLELQKYGITVEALPCSNLVPFVEANTVNTAECSEAVASALFNLTQCDADTVILGCTHFPILRKKISPYAKGKKIVECCCDFQPSVVYSPKQTSQTVFLTTGLAEQANNASQWFGNTDFVHIDL